VTVDTAAIAAADDGDVETVYEYRGVVNGESVSYYLTDAEAAALDPAVYVNFGKVGTATYVRFPKDIAGDVTKADVNSLRTAVKKYTKADNPDIYLTGAEFDLIKAVDSATYGGYAVEPGEKTYYRSAGSKAFEVQGSAVLDAQFTSVNESAEVFKVTNNNTSLTLGYLTRAEILALTDADALKGYTVDFDTTYLRAAGDTTNIIQINDLTGGYVVAPGKDLAADYFIAKVTEPTVDEANAYRFQTVTLTNSKMGYLSGGASTSKGTDKLAAKKNSTIATFTRTSDSSETATGSLTAYDSSIGTAYKFDKVLLSGSEMGKYSAGDIEGGKYTYSRKAVFTSQLYDNVYDYTDSTKVLEYTETIKETFTATGSALLLNVTAGDILDYKDVTVSFDNGEDLAKNTVGSYRGIKGGTSSSTSTTTFANVDYGSYSETIEKATETAVGTVTLTNANVNGEVTGFQTANIANSEILYGLSSGNFTTTTTRVDVDYAPDSYAEEITVAAVGKATVTESKVGGSIAQFKDVELAGGVEVKGSIIVGDVDSDTPVRGASKNTACYAVFFKDSSDDLEKVVYLTEAEYKVFATKEVTAMIDPLVSVYRTKKAMTDAELKNVDKAVQDMKDYCTGYTDNAVSDSGYGQEGKNTTTWIVKTAGSSLTIDEAGATVGGKVKGYASVTVSGDSSFAAGFFGTDKTDKLTVDASLATFTTTDPVSGNPVGFDFGEGKDELVLNGTVGIQAAFKYDEATGTNAWNLETVSGSGTIVCRTEDVEDVKAAFDGINVVGSDNYNATSALKYQSVDEAKGMDNHDEFNEWLGFCDKADFFTNDLGADSILSFSGAGVDSGDVVAQMSIDGGATFATTLNDGDTIVKGAVVRVSFSTGSKNTTSSDYTIAFK